MEKVVMIQNVSQDYLTINKTLYVIPFEKFSEKQIMNLKKIHNKTLNKEYLPKKIKSAAMWFMACLSCPQDKPWDDEDFGITEQEYINFDEYGTNKMKTTFLKNKRVVLYISYAYTED